MIIYCEKPGFGQILSSFSLNRSTIRLKRPQNLSQTSLFSLQFPKSDRLLELLIYYNYTMKNTNFKGLLNGIKLIWDVSNNVYFL